MKEKFLRVLSIIAVITILLGSSACSDKKEEKRKKPRLADKVHTDEPGGNFPSNEGSENSPAVFEENEKLLKEETEDVTQEEENAEEKAPAESVASPEIPLQPPTEEIKIEDIALPEMTEQEEKKAESNPVESFVATEGPALNAVMDEVMKQSGVECKSSMRAEGNKVIIRMAMPMFDAVPEEKKPELKSVFEPLKEMMEGLMGDSFSSVPGLKGVVYEFSTSQNEVLARYEVKN